MAWEALEEARMRDESGHTTAWLNLSQVQHALGTGALPEGSAPSAAARTRRFPAGMKRSHGEHPSLVSIADKQLSKEVKAVRIQLLNGIPRKRQWRGGGWGFLWDPKSWEQGASKWDQTGFPLFPVSQEVEKVQGRMEQCEVGCRKELLGRLQDLGESWVLMENP